MKTLILTALLVALCLPMQMFAQQVNLMRVTNLIEASQNDSLFVTNVDCTFSQGRVRVFRSDVGRDTIVTKWIYMKGMNADITVELGFIPVSGRDSVSFNVQTFRGFGTPDSTGISTHLLETFNLVLTDTTKTFHIGDSTWVSKRLFHKYRIQIHELGSQQNDYILNINQYSPLQKNPILRRN